MVTAVPNLDGEARIDLRQARVLCADETTQGLEILGQILMGFGVQTIVRAQSGEDFRRTLGQQAFDLILVDGGLGGNGFEFIQWLRHSSIEINRYTATVALSGHTPRTQVELARDCGANFVVIKPVSPATLLDRVMWVGRTARMFVESETYVGPDRRFKNTGVPVGTKGRRKGDLSADVGEAVDPNMSQDDIDNLMKPNRVAL